MLADQTMPDFYIEHLKRILRYIEKLDSCLYPELRTVEHELEELIHHASHYESFAGVDINQFFTPKVH